MTSFPSSETKKTREAPEFKSNPLGVLGSSLGLFCQEAVVNCELFMRTFRINIKPGSSTEVTEVI